MAVYTKTDTSELVATSGDDIILVELPENLVLIDGGDGFDELRLTAGSSTGYTLNSGIQNIERVVIGTGAGEVADTSSTVSIDVNNFSLLALEVVGNEGKNVITAGNESDTLLGLGGDDELSGRGGADTLDGGAGADTMVGGSGNDTYIVDDIGDVVADSLGLSKPVPEGFGIDAVLASIDFILPTDLEEETRIENLVLTGNADLSGTGNGIANHIIGNTGSNILDGGLGNDTLEGGLGDDMYIVASGDQIIEAAASGIDRVIVSANWTLAANVEELVLSGFGNYAGTGNSAANEMIGNSGRNVLNGAGANDQLFGNYGSDSLLGGAGDDVLEGEAGNDTLVGGTGIDLLSGGTGMDVFIWDALDAVADEAISGGAGRDTLRVTAGTLNLTTLGQDIIQGIEIVDLGATSGQTLRLSQQDLLDLSNTSNALEVAGTSADKVIVAGGTWTDAGTKTIGAQLYDVYKMGAATLLVDADITLTITLG